MTEEEILERRYQIRLYLDQARLALESAASSIENGFYATAINRAYYAIFYAATAILLTKDIRRKKHSGLIAAFRQVFVKPGLIERQYSNIYGDALDSRLGSDYDATFESDLLTAQTQLEQAQRFVERIERYLYETEGIR